jgi:chromosomal replication initiator protein
MMDNGYSQDLWAQMLGTLESELSAITFDVWFKALEVEQLEGDKLVLLAPTSKVRDFVVGRYYDLVKRVMQQHNSLLRDLEILDPDDLENKPMAKPHKDSKPDTNDTIRTTIYETVVLNRKYTFDTFVVGKSNQQVYETAQSIAESPGTRYNPLFIYGGVGLGKTHIMHAIGNAIIGNALNRGQEAPRVLYVSSEKFTNDFIEAIRVGSQSNNSFRDKYRSVDVLMVDDVQFFGNKEGTQEEFFHTFNELYNAGRQIVLTSDRPPKDIGGLADRLKSRFECGIKADVQSPDLETRIAILQKKAQMDNQNIPYEMLEFMAKHVDKNVRELEGLLNKVIFLAKMEFKQPTIETVEMALKDFEEKTQGSITIDDIIESTCTYCSISKDDIVGKKKTKEIAEARQLCMYIITELLNVPLATIGSYFGGRDHTTVMHSRNKVADAIRDGDRRLKSRVEDIKSMVLSKR